MTVQVSNLEPFSQTNPIITNPLSVRHDPSVFERQKGTGLGRTPYSLFCASHMGYFHGDFMGFPGIDGG